MNNIENKNEKLRPGQKIKMISYDELCGGPASDIVSAEQMISIDKIDDFKNHPFKVIDDEKMNELVESIAENGILSPVIVRSKEDGRYELISGHRRCHAAVRAGLTEIPALIKELDDEEATVLMVDANIQREEILPSERAKSLQMKIDALNKMMMYGTRKGNRSRDMAGEEAGLSGRQVQNYLKLNNLIPEFMDMVDSKKIQMVLGTELASMRSEIQTWIYEYVKIGSPINMELVRKLRQVDETEGLDEKVVGYILKEDDFKQKARKITISERKLNHYFPEFYSVEDMETVLYQLLDQWKRNQEREANNE